MRLLSRALVLGTLLACGAPTELPQPLDGIWKLDSASAGEPPRTMTLTQRGTTISGTGSANGVDVPMPLAITGTYSPSTRVSPPLVALIFTAENGGGMTAQYSATLQGDRIVGSVIYYGITAVPQPGTLSFVRQ